MKREGNPVCEPPLLGVSKIFARLVRAQSRLSRDSVGNDTASASNFAVATTKTVLLTAGSVPLRTGSVYSATLGRMARHTKHLFGLIALWPLAGCLSEAEPAWDPTTTQATVARSSGPATEPAAEPATASRSTASGNRVILDAWSSRRSDVWVEGSGQVVRLLSDDLEGSRHQRLIVEIADGHTILVSHNIDLAPKVPLQPGQLIRFRGEYEWNDRGGVVHWTHHDPRGRREGGWIDSGGKRYR